MAEVTQADRERARRVLCDLPVSIPGPTDADRAKAAEILRPVGFVFDRAVAERRIAAALAAEREKARAPFLALAQELATVGCDHHATVAGDAYADAADRIMAVLDGTYL